VNQDSPAFDVGTVRSFNLVGKIPLLPAFLPNLVFPGVESPFFQASSGRRQIPLSLQAMRISAFLIITFLLSGCSTSDAGSSCPDAGSLSWLAGSWKMADQDIYEVWTKDGNTRMQGTSFAIEAGDTSILEQMSMEIKDGQGVFMAAVPDQNEGRPVVFTLVGCVAGKLLFENPSHDFPNRIAYEQGDDHTLLAWVEGGTRKLTFTYQRTDP